MKNLILLSLGLLLIGCEAAIQDFEYGHDQCAYCKMTIMNSKHASQMVSTKGKVFKYDSIECLIKDKDSQTDSKFKFVMVSNYEVDSALIPADSAFYLITDKIQSPMGANVSAFKDSLQAMNMQAKHSGEIYTWDDLLMFILTK
jgi:copper chaperone NosL